MKLNSVDIDAEEGTVDVQCVESENIYFEFCAGKVDIEKQIAGSAKLETGAGKFAVRDGVLKNADLDLGVGETNITAAFAGKISVNAGVGYLELNLIGEESDYTVSVSKGIGEVSVFGNKVSDKSIIN